MTCKVIIGGTYQVHTGQISVDEHDSLCLYCMVVIMAQSYMPGILAGAKEFGHRYKIILGVKRLQCCVFSGRGD